MDAQVLLRSFLFMPSLKVEFLISFTRWAQKPVISRDISPPIGVITLGTHLAGPHTPFVTSRGEDRFSQLFFF